MIGRQPGGVGAVLRYGTNMEPIVQIEAWGISKLESVVNVDPEQLPALITQLQQAMRDITEYRLTGIAVIR